MAVDKTAVFVGLVVTIYEGILFILRISYLTLIDFFKFFIVFISIFLIAEYFINPKLPQIKNSELSEKVFQSLQCDFETGTVQVIPGTSAYGYGGKDVKLDNPKIKNLVIDDRDFDSAIISYMSFIKPKFTGKFLLSDNDFKDSEIEFKSSYSIIGDERKLSALNYGGKIITSVDSGTMPVILTKHVSPVCLK